METVQRRDKWTHHGHNIKRIRQTLNWKQEVLAQALELSQQTISTYEQKRHIDDEMLEKFAVALNVPVDVIKELEEDPVSIMIENNTFENNEKVSNIGNYEVEDNSVNHFNPVDKIVELCEKMLERDQEKIALLEKILKNRL